MTVRIRWEDNADGGHFGYVGSLGEHVFRLWPPDTFCAEWVLTSRLTEPWNGTARGYASDPAELKARAEERLTEFAASLGALFPAALGERPEPAATDLVAVCLRDARKRWEAFGEADSFPRLLAAVEAALALLADWDKSARYCDKIAERAEQAPRRVLLGARAQAHDECAKALREAIATALLGGT